jgi:glycine cleavage system aminomethyltransferase T/glycine/D-amino acid oxidase-like deaminating enzyme
MRDRADLVIIGAGIVGTSAAYYFTEKGWRDIVVLDQGPLFETGGSSSHAPGLVFQLNPSKTMCQLARWSVELYSTISLDGLPGFYTVGSMEIAYSPERHQELTRKLGHAMSWGLPAEIIGPEEIKRQIPILSTGRIYSAFYVPSDGLAKAVRVAEVLSRVARERGTEFHGHIRVAGIEVANGRVQAVVTEQGRIRTEKLLLCAGIWGPRIGRMAGVPIPLIPVEHQYAKTAPVPELAGETREIAHPILRHQDRSMYFRQHADCYGIGSYQHEPLVVDPDELQANAFKPFTEEHFKKAHRDAFELFPCLRGIDLHYKINGMFSFTPDGNPLLGESHDVRGFWIAEAVWVTHAAGVGRVIAEWMAEGIPSVDLRELDYHRFHSHAFSPAYIRARGAQQYREVYDIIHPLQQMESPRNLRVSPFHRRQQELGAVFFENAGWERPQWFAANENLSVDPAWPRRTGWMARYWSPIIGAEHLATRSRVALYDLTPFTKLEIAGPGSLEFLQWLTSNQIDGPAGKVTYTSMLTERGGIQCDLTVTCLADDRFLVITGGFVGMHDFAWIRAHLPADGSVSANDLTGAFCCIGVWGPCARELLQRTSGDDFRNESFPYLIAKRVTIGHVPALALRISYVGEMGWEVYAPTEYGLKLWDTLWEAGHPLGIVAAGGGAFDSLRLEKGYRLWGSDIHSEYDPYEAGLIFAVKLGKGDFLGKHALGHIKAQGVARKLCCVTFDDPSIVVMGKEPIVDGEHVLGYVTSANYGYSVCQSIAYGYLPVGYAAEGTPVDIYFFGQRHKATVSHDPLFDPKNLRLKM